MKNCWIIGASFGIGRELAKTYFQNGYNIIISARTISELQILKDEIKQNSNSENSVFVVGLDVTNYDSIKKALEIIIKQFNKIDLAIYASGIYRQMNLRNFDIDFSKQILDINFTGGLNFLHIITPIMINQKSGHIALIASVAGYVGLPESMVYGASKAAMINLCEGVQAELKSYNINLSIINPGFVKTRLTDTNNFEMPFIINTKQASNYIYQGLENKKFEIHFPKRFTLFLKILRIIPYSLLLKINQKIFSKNTSSKKNKINNE